MTDSPLLSIILPVYNVAPFLKKCIDSLLAQTYPNIELIIINDGSTDASPAICDEYQDQPQVTLIHQDNHGLAYCHRYGLELAHGELITFMDSDDWVDPTMYAELIKAMQDADAEIGACGRYLVTEQDEQVIGTEFTGDPRVIDRVTAMYELLLEHKLDSSICDKVFTRSILEKTKFPTQCYHDDVAIFYQTVHYATRLVHIGKPYYHYRQRTNSISSMPLSAGKLDLLHFSRQIYQFIRADYPHLANEAAYLYYRNLKNLRALLATQGAADQAVATVLINDFKASASAALRNRHFKIRDRLVILALQTNFYTNLKLATSRLNRRDG